MVALTDTEVWLSQWTVVSTQCGRCEWTVHPVSAYQTPDSVRASWMAVVCCVSACATPLNIHYVRTCNCHTPVESMVEYTIFRISSRVLFHCQCTCCRYCCCSTSSLLPGVQRVMDATSCLTLAYTSSGVCVPSMMRTLPSSANCCTTGLLSLSNVTKRFLIASRLSSALPLL